MRRFIAMLRPTLKYWLLTLLILGGMTVLRSGAQQPSPGAMIVPINVTKTIPVKPGARVKSVAVSKPGILRAEVSLDARSVLLTGEVAGTTQVTIEDSEGGKNILNVVVQTDVEFLHYLIQQTAPTANVRPIPIGNNGIILTGTVAKTEDIPVILATAQSVAGQGVVNGMRVGGVMQVQLDVVIAQVSRSELRNMSFSFFHQGNQFFFGSLLTSPSTASNALQIGLNAVEGTATGSGNLLLSFIRNEQGFFGFLRALRNEGLAKLLAEPRLVTMSGKPASFLSGGRLAIPEPSGLGTTAVRYEDFGTELNFLPIVQGDGKIYLEVEPVVNNVNAALGTTIAGTTVPGFNTQRLHTSVELEDGQTFVIGGLIQTQIDATTSKVPWLGDLPFINTFFSNKNFTQTETELLVVVTPHLVAPMHCHQLPKYLPGQETRIPDDFELFLTGILEAPRGQREVFPNGHFLAAYHNSPTAATFPCGVGAYGNRHCGACPTGNCDVPLGAYRGTPVGSSSIPPANGGFRPGPNSKPETLPAPNLTTPSSVERIVAPAGYEYPDTPLGSPANASHNSSPNWSSAPAAGTGRGVIREEGSIMFPPIQETPVNLPTPTRGEQNAPVGYQQPAVPIGPPIGARESGTPDSLPTTAPTSGLGLRDPRPGTPAIPPFENPAPLGSPVGGQGQ